MKTNSVGRSSQAASIEDRHQHSQASRNPQIIQGSVSQQQMTAGTLLFGKPDLSVIMQTDPSLSKLHLKFNRLRKQWMATDLCMNADATLNCI